MVPAEGAYGAGWAGVFAVGGRAAVARRQRRHPRGSESIACICGSGGMLAPLMMLGLPQPETRDQLALLASWRRGIVDGKFERFRPAKLVVRYIY